MNRTLKTILDKALKSDKTGTEGLRTCALNMAANNFNTVSLVLFSSLSEHFPDDAALRTLKQELARYSSPLCKDIVTPGINFFSMTYQTKFDSRPISDLILAHEESLFAPDSKVHIPQLDLIKFKEKWAALTYPEKDSVWRYLQILTPLSAAVMYLHTVTDEELSALLNKSQPAKPNPF
jgi:hypothetical protein